MEDMKLVEFHYSAYVLFKQKRTYNTTYLSLIINDELTRNQLTKKIRNTGNSNNCR